MIELDEDKTSEIIHEHAHTSEPMKWKDRNNNKHGRASEESTRQVGQFAIAGDGTEISRARIFDRCATSMRRHRCRPL